MNKRLIVLLATFIVLLVAVVIYSYNHQSKSKPPFSQDQVQTKDIVKTKLNSDMVPEKFPIDMPIEKDATLTQNYNATTKEGYFQATRAFLSKQSLVQNLNLYKEYLNKTGYKISSTLDRPNYKMLYAIKDKAALQVSISENSNTKNKTVTISYTEMPQ